MARPRKPPREVRRRVIPIRLTDEEVILIKERAAAAGVPYGRYLREAGLGKAPRAKPHAPRVVRALVREMLHIANNFRQLASITGDATFQKWAHYAGVEMLETLLDRESVAPVIEQHLKTINDAGHLINQVAKKANSGEFLKREYLAGALNALKNAVAPIHAAIAAAPPLPTDRRGRRGAKKK